MTQPEVFERWFKKVKEVYDKHDFHNKPSHVFNCDESGFQCNQGKVRIVTRKGFQNPKTVSTTGDKISYTILSCCNGLGNLYECVNINFNSLKGQCYECQEEKFN